MECETMEEEHQTIKEVLEKCVDGTPFIKDLVKEVFPDENIRVVFHTQSMDYEGLYILPKNGLKILFIK